MNDLLLSRSFKRSVVNDSSPPHSHIIEMAKAMYSRGSFPGGNKFFLDVEEMNNDLKELDRLCYSIRSGDEKSKTLLNANAVKELKVKMDADVSAALKTAKRVKGNLEALDRVNKVNRNLPESGLGSSSDQQRTITSENPDEDTVDRLISTGESEIIISINEIQERNELHQVFLDMAVLVEHQGQHVDDIEGNVKRANSLVMARFDQANKKNMRMWACFAIWLLIIIVVSNLQQNQD